MTDIDDRVTGNPTKAARRAIVTVEPSGLEKPR